MARPKKNNIRVPIEKALKDQAKAESKERKNQDKRLKEEVKRLLEEEKQMKKMEREMKKQAKLEEKERKNQDKRLKEEVKRLLEEEKEMKRQAKLNAKLKKELEKKQKDDLKKEKELKKLEQKELKNKERQRKLDEKKKKKELKNEKKKQKVPVQKKNDIKGRKKWGSYESDDDSLPMLPKNWNKPAKKPIKRKPKNQQKKVLNKQPINIMFNDLERMQIENALVESAKKKNKAQIAKEKRKKTVNQLVDPRLLEEYFMKIQAEKNSFNRKKKQSNLLMNKWSKLDAKNQDVKQLFEEINNIWNSESESNVEELPVEMVLEENVKKGKKTKKKHPYYFREGDSPTEFEKHMKEVNRQMALYYNKVLKEEGINLRPPINGKRYVNKKIVFTPPKKTSKNKKFQEIENKLKARDLKEKTLQELRIRNYKPKPRKKPKSPPKKPVLEIEPETEGGIELNFFNQANEPEVKEPVKGMKKKFKPVAKPRQRQRGAAVGANQNKRGEYLIDPVTGTLQFQGKRVVNKKPEKQLNKADLYKLAREKKRCPFCKKKLTFVETSDGAEKITSGIWVCMNKQCEKSGFYIEGNAMYNE